MTKKAQSKGVSAPPASGRDWYRIHAKGGPRALGENEAEIDIFGDIGEDWLAEESNTAKRLIGDLRALGDGVEYLTVRLNSYGGSVSDGLAIYNALKRHPAAVTVTVEGVAVSIASLIAMAGDTVMMPANTLMMIHAPWSLAMGNARDMRETADVLDTYAEAMASSYAEKTGRPLAEMLELLSDGEDHWYTAAEAVEAGFADSMTQEVAVAASLRMNRFHIPAAVAADNPAAPAASPPKEESTMAVKDNATAPQADGNISEPQGPTNVTEIEKATEARLRDQINARNTDIANRFKPFMSHEGISALYHEVLADTKVSADEAGQKLLAKLAEGVEPLTPKGYAPRVDAGLDETEKRRGAACAALMVRAGVATPEIRAQVDGQNPYRGMRLVDMARDSLTRAGVRVDGMDPMQIAKAAFTQSTDDFPVLLENAMHKTMQNAYAVAPDTWSRFCATGSVSDFRDHNRYRIGSLGNLESVKENGEYTNKPIPDGERSVVSVGTKGYIINVTRKMIVNDDLGAFMGLAAGLGRAAARSIEADVYAVINQNSGLGPTQSDSQPLLHSNRNNVDSTGGVNSVARWEAMRVIMAQQMDVGGNDYLDLRPAIWLGPIGISGLARQINEAKYDDESQKNQRRPNITRGLVRDIVDTPRLTSTTRYYLLADPADAPVFEVSFLDGQQMPFLDREEGFRVDGTQWKVRLDYGVSVIDYRGIVTNAGQ